MQILFTGLSPEVQKLRICPWRTELHGPISAIVENGFHIDANELALLANRIAVPGGMKLVKNLE